MKGRLETLVMLTPAFPASEQETSWVTTQQVFVLALRQQFPELRIVLLSFYYPESVGSYDWSGFQVISFNGTAAALRKWRRVFFLREVWKRLKGLLRENTVIGIFSFWCGECALIGHYFGRRYGIPHYCWLCGQDARAKNKLVKWIRPHPGELIAMSDFLVREFQRNHGIRPGHMIPNGIDPGMYPAGVQPERTIDVLGVGSLSRLKQYDVFVEVTAALQHRFPSLRSMICGEGEAGEEIRQLVGKRGLERHIALPGLTPHREILKLMQRTKILLHTSNYEGFGVVCLEALYAGAHVISFCRPMDQDVSHWHIVSNVKEMIEKAISILEDTGTDHSPVLPFEMKQTVQAVMRLFHK
ncbi:MAG TPA: glycosyltransferase [Puia sp.]|nr:glycosyltransferase [Puia sp.]